MTNLHNSVFIVYFQSCWGGGGYSSFSPPSPTVDLPLINIKSLKFSMILFDLQLRRKVIVQFLGIILMVILEKLNASGMEGLDKWSDKILLWQSTHSLEFISRPMEI